MLRIATKTIIPHYTTIPYQLSLREQHVVLEYGQDLGVLTNRLFVVIALVETIAAIFILQRELKLLISIHVAHCLALW